MPSCNAGGMLMSSRKRKACISVCRLTQTTACQKGPGEEHDKPHKTPKYDVLVFNSVRSEPHLRKFCPEGRRALLRSTADPSDMDLDR